MELGVDEAYYWFYSQDIKWNYFDHPPLVAIWIRAFSANLLLQHIEGLVRFGSVIGAALASWAIYKTCETLHSAKAALFGVCLYNASVYASVTAGIFIMPDTPQMVFYTIALWMLSRIIKAEKNWINWIVFGIAAGLCIMSKVYGGFLWLGVGLFTLLKKREWLTQPYIYLAFLVSAVIASPILIWNIQNDFLMFRFHSNRFADNGSTVDIIEFFREVTQQLLYNNPFNVFIMAAALLAFWKKGREQKPQHDTLTLFNFVALPLAILLLILALFRDPTLPHWSGQAYVALIPLAAVYLTTFTIRHAKGLLYASLTSLLLFLIVWQYLIHFEPELLARNADKRNLQKEKGIVSRLFNGFKSFQLIAKPKKSWEPAGDAFLQIYQQGKSNDRVNKKTPIICYDWGGALIEYYFGRPNNIPVIGLGEPNELHQYLFSNVERKDKVNLDSAYCILPEDDPYDVQVKYSSYYHQIKGPERIKVKREGKPDERFNLYRLHGWKGRLPVVE